MDNDFGSITHTRDELRNILSEKFNLAKSRIDFARYASAMRSVGWRYWNSSGEMRSSDVEEMAEKLFNQAFDLAISSSSYDSVSSGGVCVGVKCSPPRVDITFEFDRATA